MPADPIETLREQYTDRYVVVDASRPELARFAGQVGQIKTVNYNGRALVQFDGANRGWYDIAPEFLTIVDKPEPKPVAAKPVCKATAKKEAAAGKLAVPEVSEPGLASEASPEAEPL